MKRVLKKLFPGVSWQNPIVNSAFRVIDPVDYAVRLRNGLSRLPRYSVRVRSNGVTNQFGGKNFHKFGIRLTQHLEQFANLHRNSKVLEIGCGCGRTAYALAGALDDGNFVGMDIEKLSLQSCQKSPLFQTKGFRFDYLDIQNDEYNPSGKIPASLYRFPYDDNQFDVIFLVSVFTHMLTDDVKNYMAEISRMLKPGGVCMVTMFLMDKGCKTNGISFPHQVQNHFYYNVEMPEVAVGYQSEFISEQFSAHGMHQVHATQWGSWRNMEDVESTSGFPQDIVFFAKS